jgi:GPI-anchor transamidase subunit U
MAIFKSYPSIADTSLYFGLLAMYPEIFKYAQYPYFAIVSILYASILGPLFFNIWVHASEVRSTLAAGIPTSSMPSHYYSPSRRFTHLTQVILISDAMYAFVRRDWERNNPGWRAMKIDIVYK